MFFVHPLPEEFKNATNTGYFGFVSEGKSRDYPTSFPGLFSAKALGTRHHFQKLRFQTVFSPHENEMPPFSNSSDLKSVFE